MKYWSVFVTASLVMHGALLALWRPDDVTVAIPAADAPLTISLTTAAPRGHAIQPPAPRGSVTEPAHAVPATAAAAPTSPDMPDTVAAAATPAQATPPETSAADTRERVFTTLSGAVARHFHYPPLARSRGWQGHVRLGVHVAPDGHLRDIRVVASSGYRVLDHAALNSLQRVARLPEVAGWRIAQGFDMVVPVEYRLIDG